MSSFVTGPNPIVTGATHRPQSEYTRTVDGVEYILYVPQRNCSAEMQKDLNKIITKIATEKYGAKNDDDIDIWIRAIQNVFDNHADELPKNFKKFHQRKVYFYNKNYDGSKGQCAYLAVKRKNKPGKKSEPQDQKPSSSVIDIDLDNISSEDESLGSLSEIESSDESELLSDSDIESEDGDIGPRVGYNRDTPTKRITIAGQVVYRTENEKDPKLYNKQGLWIGNLKTDGSIESKEIVEQRYKDSMKKSSQGGRKSRKKRRTRRKKRKSSRKKRRTRRKKRKSSRRKKSKRRSKK